MIVPLRRLSSGEPASVAATEAWTLAQLAEECERSTGVPTTHQQLLIEGAHAAAQHEQLAPNALH